MTMEIIFPLIESNPTSLKSDKTGERVPLCLNKIILKYFYFLGTFLGDLVSYA